MKKSRKPRKPEDPKDFTLNNQCVRCGNCCPSFLPVTQEELDRAKAEADRIGFKPSIPVGVLNDAVYLRCPFLLPQEPDKGPTGMDVRKCAVHDVRPAICRSFMCCRNNLGNMRKYSKITGGQEPPELVKLWSVYNRTGFIADGQEIMYDDAPYVEITLDTGIKMRIQVGRALHITHKTGITSEPLVAVAIFQDGVQVVSTVSNELMFVNFDDIIGLSDNCIVREEPRADGRRLVTIEQIRRGFEQKLIRVDSDPNEMEAVACHFGPDGYWFYFHPENISSGEMTVEEFLEKTPRLTLCSEIADAVNGFLDYEEGYDEFDYYRAVLDEHDIK